MKGSIVLIILISLNFVSMQNNTVTASFNAACTGINPNKDLFSSAEVLNKLRTYFTNNFSGFRDILTEFLTNFNVSVFLRNYTVLLPYLIPMGIILIGSLFSFFFFLFNIFSCCCKKNEKNKNYKLWFIISIVLFVIVTALLILFYIYLGNLISSIKLLNCTFAKIPNDLFNGLPANNTFNITFIGINKLLSSFTSITSNFSQLQSVTTNFNNILGQNLSDKTQAAETAYNSTISALSSERSYDPQTQTQQTPFLISNYTTLSSPIKIEINALNEIGKSIDSSARLVTTQFNNDSLDQFTQITNSATTQLNNLSTQIENIFSQINITRYDYVINIVIYVALGMCIAIFLFVILNLIISYCIKKEKCKFELLTRIFIFILALFDLIITILMIAMFVIFLITTVFCSVYQEFLAGNFPPLQNFIANNDSTGFIANVFNNCIYSTGTGDLRSIINVNTNPQLDQVNSLVDGIAVIGNRFNQYDNISSSQSIPRIIQELNNFKNQTRNNYVSVPALLTQLNGLGCSRPISFTSADCSSGNCFLISVLTQAEFTSQGNCTNQSEADGLFTRLKTYYDQDIPLINRVESQINGVNPRITEIYSSFTSIRSDINTIQQNLSGFIQSITTFTSGIFSSLDCRILNLNFREIETSLCVNLNFYSFPFLIVLILLSYFLCFINCSIFYLFKHAVKKNKKNKK